MRSIRMTRNEAEHLVGILTTCAEKDDHDTLEIEREVREVFGMLSRAEVARCKSSFEHFQSIAYPGTFAKWYQENYPEPLP